MTNWYIGQPIVAIRTHSARCFSKGQQFTVIGLKRSGCGCKVLIHIGINAPSGHVYREACDTCAYESYTNDPTWWFSEENFAPLDVNIEELTELLTQKVTA